MWFKLRYALARPLAALRVRFAQATRRLRRGRIRGVCSRIPHPRQIFRDSHGQISTHVYILHIIPFLGCPPHYPPTTAAIPHPSSDRFAARPTASGGGLKGQTLLIQFIDTAGGTNAFVRAAASHSDTLNVKLGRPACALKWTNSTTLKAQRAVFPHAALRVESLACHFRHRRRQLRCAAGE